MDAELNRRLVAIERRLDELDERTASLRRIGPGPVTVARRRQRAREVADLIKGVKDLKVVSAENG